MRPLPRPRPATVGLAVVLVAMGAAGFIPLFGGPGYESALAAGLILPSAVAITTALETSAAPLAPIAAFSRGVSLGFAFAFAAWLTTLAHGLAGGFCDLPGGSAHFALGPAAGALLAGAWGAVAGELARRRRRRRLAAVLLALAAPIGSILTSVGRFYTSPMIFAYDPFVGFFSGTLYDTVIDFSGLLSYRAGTAATLLAALALALHLSRDDRGRLALRWIGHPALAAAGALAFVGSVACTASGPRLGHWQTSATIASALGARVEGERCSVVYPRSLRLADMQRFAHDCDAHVAAGERWLGASGPPRITAFVFESAAQKGALMGAADTFIAKPWRREVYVQAQSYPHPVLGHEVAHVLAGSFGRGPFRVAGALGGLVPDPGLIEGVAVAAEPREGDLAPREWARAMKDLKLLPALDRLFTLGFLGENAGVAYTVSGAFVGWVHDRFGAEAVRAWYGGRPLPEVTGSAWADLEREWHADLDRVTLPEAARAQARARFTHPALFARRCPHVVDGCKGRANHLAAGGDYPGAIAELTQVLALDPHDDGARVTIARHRIRDGALAEGTGELERIAASEAVPRHVRDRALEELADLALSAGGGDAAAGRYRELMTRTIDEDVLRTLEIKVAAAGDERARPAVVALLVGTGGHPPDRSTAMELLRDWAVGASDDGAADGLPWYLLGRQQFNAGQLDEARTRLDRALAAPIRLSRVRIEAERLRMVIACALGDGAGAARFFAMYAGHPEIGDARREGARALLGRCYDAGAGRSRGR